MNTLEVITLEESQRLNELEQVITFGQAQWLEVGLALTEIRDRKLYRSEYATFKDYCKTVWKWSDQRAYQLIAATAENSTSGLGFKTERAARAAIKARKVPASVASQPTEPPADDDADPWEKPRVTADDQFRSAMGMPTEEAMESELEQIQAQLKAIEIHITDADLTGEDFCLLAKEIFRMSERVSRIGKSKKVAEAAL